MRSFFYLISIITLLSACGSSNTPATNATSSANITVFKNVAVIPVTANNRILEAQTVVIEDGLIKTVGPADEVNYPASATVIDGTGKYLTPGLTEMHAHIPTPRNGSDSLVRETLFLYLSQGVTTIRGMLGHPYHLDLKKQIDAGTILSPRVYTSSPSMNGNTIKTPEAARDSVTKYQKAGYDFLKVHPGVKLEVFKEMVKTANEVGIPYAGHVPVEVGINRAIESGYATVDHLDGYIDGLLPENAQYDINGGGFFGYNFTDSADPERIQELAAKTKQYNVGVVPTQTLFTRWFSPTSGAELANEPEMKYMAPSTLYQWRQSKERSIQGDGYTPERYAKFIEIRHKLLQGLKAAGVDILLGSDAPQVFNVPGFSLLHEMETMADAGLTPYEILESGTYKPAAFFDQEGQYGQIVPNASADLILLDANPLVDISNIRKQSGVMVRGQWLSKAEIEEELAAISENYAR